MHQNAQDVISQGAFLEGKTLTILPKHPWDQPLKPLERFTLFRRHVGPPTDSSQRDPLEVATDVALDHLYAAGRLKSDMAFSHHSLMCLSEESRVRMAVSISEAYEGALAMLRTVCDAHCRHLAPVSARFTMAPPERVRLYGRVFDSAHAAAGEAIPGLIDLWRMARQLVDDLAPGPAAVAMPELLLEILRQLESTPIEELLLQVAREHLRLREHSGTQSTPVTDAAEPAQMPARALSRGHTKKVLADFFAVDVRLLMRELKERQVMYTKSTRQSYRIDLDTLDDKCRREFQEKLER